MKYIYKILSICFLCLFIACDKPIVEPQNSDDDTMKDTSNSTDSNQDTVSFEIVNLKLTTPQLVASNNQFGFELFSHLFAQSNGKQNIFISPMSVSMALTMAYNGAAGSTKTAIETTLKHSGLSNTSLNQTNQYLLNALVNADDDVLLTIANAIFYEQNFSVLQSFIDTNITYLDASVHPLDFMNPESSEYINQWVSEKTNGLIPKMIEGRIPADAVMYLINALYFKGIWKYQFDEANTVERAFFVDNETIINVPTMHIFEIFRYAYNDIAEIVELPYGNSSYSMFIVLPHINNKTNEFEFSDVVWKQWRSSLEKQQLHLALPKFSFEYANSLRSILSDMGMFEAFSSSLADFSNISEFQKVSISDVMHKTFVEVSEAGTEAAAATSVEVFVTSVQKTCTVNRPFLFVIQEKNTESIVFIGHVFNPLQK